MKKIIIRFLGLGVGDKYQACVRIYDTCNNLLCEGKTCNGKLELCLEENQMYKLYAIFMGEDMNKTFYVTNSNNIFNFVFNKLIITCPLRTITFLLTDANYTNLPIEKGKMVLWQKQ